MPSANKSQAQMHKGSFMTYPMIIQGGMGAGVSGWQLAKAVSGMGQLGVVSGTALDQILARRLQQGDPGGHLRRALQHFPNAEMVDRILKSFYIPGGKSETTPFIKYPRITLDSNQMIQELTILGNFAEVFLAKEGHINPVGLNLLEKIQLPNIFALYGAMLAGVDYVIMGAGIPREIPGILDRLSVHDTVSLKIFVEEAAASDDFRIGFDPKIFLKQKLPPLKRPKFLAIISSVTLAVMMKKKATGKVDGFVIEAPVAGGHNAPPRGKLVLNAKGEPVYGQRDVVDFEKIKDLNLPFWLAGSWGNPQKLKEAIATGAQGVQIGTAFAFSEESGFTTALKTKIIKSILHGDIAVFTDPVASPTGFPFKVLSVNGTLSEKNVYQSRRRVCDLGYLRHPYKKYDGIVGYRCPAEPGSAYLQKGGKPFDIEGKKCLCNALLSNIGLAQSRKNGYIETPLITSGDDILTVARILGQKSSYHAADVINWLLNGH
jgi:nitronate monooxygenase